MGRTLHYELTPKNGKFTNGELEKIFEVSEKVRKSTKWTCDEFSINPYDFYPNWRKDDNHEKGWKRVKARQDCLLLEGEKYLKTCKILVEEKLALFHNRGKPANGFSDYCKVGGNEKNAMEVIAGLTVISIAVKNTEIKIHDEGKYLKCPIIIYQGKAKPDREIIFENIGYYMTRQWDPAYKNCKDYDWVKMSKELYDIAKKHEIGWFDIQSFCRCVCKKSFEKYPEYNTGQIMAGFDGEYYGLTDKDPEIESYKMSAMVKKMLPPGLKMEVAPKI